ncbi:MAG: autotransporter domain-containing protein [Deltaproteobacteria bacterium]|jgi:outer membrane autotransporter protein|nr:autotransporter domain-containing protein [Deltaproteobacteria bacterium]
MEHRQKTWGGLTLVSASLAMVLGALLFLGNGVAWGGLYNGTNVTVDGTDADGSGTVLADMDGGNISAGSNISLNNTAMGNLSNITAVDNIVIQGNSTININTTQNAGTSEDGGLITAGGNFIITDSKLNVSESGSGTGLNITVTGDIILSNGTITASDGNISQLVSTEGSVILDNGSLVNLTGSDSGNISGNQSVIINNATTVVADSIDVTEGRLNITDRSNVNATGNITANKTITIGSSNVTAANINSTEGNIDILANSLVNATDGYIIANGSLTIDSSNVTGNLTALEEGISITGSNINATGAAGEGINANLTVEIVTSNVILGDAGINSSNGSVILSGDNVTGAFIEANQSIQITGGQTNLTGNITAGTYVTIEDAVRVNGTNIQTAAGDINISGSNINLSGNITANEGNISIVSGNVSTELIQSVNGSVNISGVNVLNLTPVSAASGYGILANTSINIEDVGLLNLTGTGSAGIINSTSDSVRIANTRFAAETNSNWTVYANTSVDYDNVNGSFVDIIGENGYVDLISSNLNVSGNITAATDVVIAGTSLNMSGASSWINATNGDLTIVGSTLIAADTQFYSNNSIAIDDTNGSVGNLTADKAGVAISGSNLNLTGNIVANTSVALSGTTLNMTVPSSWINATNGALSITGGTLIGTDTQLYGNQSVEIDNTVGAVGNLTANSTYVSITESNLNVSGDILAATDVSFTNTTLNMTGASAWINATGGDLAIVGGSLIAANTQLFANNSVSIDGTKGSVGALTAENGALSIINEADFNVSGNISASSGVVVDNSALNLTGTSAFIETASGDIAINGSVVNFAGSNGVITTGTSNGSVVIDGSTVTVADILTGTNGNLLITGDSSKVNVTNTVENTNGSIEISGGTNSLSLIDADRTNIVISNGENYIANLLNVAPTESDGSLSLRGGNNTIDNIFLENISLVMSQNSNNTLRGFVSVNNGRIASSADFVNLAGAYVYVDNGSVAFTNGTVTMGNTGFNITNPVTGSSSVTASGEDTEIILTSNSFVDFDDPSNSGFILSGGSEISAFGSGIPGSRNFINGSIRVGDDSGLNIGQNNILEVGQGVFLNDGSFLNLLGTSSADLGQLEADVDYNGTVEVMFNDGNITAANMSNFVGATIINGTVDNVTPNSKFESPFFDITVNPAGQAVVNSYVGFTGAISKSGFDYTRNFASAANLLDRLYNDSLVSTDPDFKAMGALAGYLVYGGYYAANHGYSDLVEYILRQSIGEATVNVRNAVATTIFKANSVVLGRLDKIHTADLNTPPAAGEGLLNRAWIGGFGSWSKQDDDDDVAGYKYDAGGFALGYDRTFDGVPGLVLGASMAFSFGEIKVNHDMGKIDTDTFSLGIYGSYKFDNGLFLDGTVAYSTADNDSTVNVPVLGRKSGSFDIDSWQFGIRGGWILQAGNFEITPSIGVRYLHMKQDGWREHSNVNRVLNYFDGYNDDLVDIPLQVKINTTIDAGDAKITPELRLGWTYTAKELDNKVNVGFVGYRGTMPIWGITPPRSTFQVGAGLKVKINDTVDVFANYDLDVASDYYDHKASLGIGFEF